ncbi:type IV toxin-antitoxin system YeeU family antitoxin [Aeromonas veronii]|uniref:type IV toxin-antitoxin system YeeU family antitoxin n=1 Tax=Aeromonas TaxID=642 RepID=UPI0038D2FC4C
MTTTHSEVPTAETEHSVAPQTYTRDLGISWGLPRDITPRFGARLIQSSYRLDFLSDRASLIGEWSQIQIDKLDEALPEIIKAMETKLLTGDLDAQHQHCITIQHGGFTCEADSLGSHGYVYIAIYPAISADITHCAKA